MDPFLRLESHFQWQDNAHRVAGQNREWTFLDCHVRAVSEMAHDEVWRIVVAPKVVEGKRDVTNPESRRPAHVWRIRAMGANLV
jgi:hypothetical protein